MKLAIQGGIYDLDVIRGGYNEFAKGGGIHIDPSKKGTFTAAATKHGMGVQEFASKVLAHPENYSPAMRKKANFARNFGSKKHSYGGVLQGPIVEDAMMHIHDGGLNNYYEDGGFLNWLKGLFSSEPQKKYKAADGSIHASKEEAVQRNTQLIKEGKAYYQQENRSKGVQRKLIPRQPNTSSTAQKSQFLENRMYTYLDANRERVGYRTRPYDIPYGDKEIKVKPKGTTLPFNISVNALDSVAKYAGVTGTPIQTALGLPYQETAFGKKPVFNYGKLGEGYTAQDLGNTNYFKNFGSIPAEYLVRDFRYNGDIIYKGKRDNPIPLSIAPLQHALEYFNAGKYNPGDPNHTKDVKAAGDALWNETTGSLANWWNTEGKSWYDKGKKQRK